MEARGAVTLTHSARGRAEGMGGPIRWLGLRSLVGSGLAARTARLGFAQKRGRESF
jgi:hypothetical protein